MMHVPTSQQQLFIFLRLRLRRVINAFSSFKLGKKSTKRTGTVRKGGKRLIGFFVALYLFLLLAGAGFLTAQDMHQRYPNPTDLVAAACLMLTLQIIVMAFASLASKELSRSDVDVEWLSSLPAPWPILLGAKVIERGFFNYWLPFVWASLFSLAYYAGVPLGLAMLGSALLIIPILLVVGLLQVVIEYFLKQKLKPHNLRNVTAALAVLTSISMMTVANPKLLNFVDWLSLSQTELRYLVHLLPGLVLSILIKPSLGLVLAYLGQFLALASLMIWILHGLLRQGIVLSGARESGRRPQREKLGFRKPYLQLNSLSPLLRRELTLLGRDRNYFVQYLFAPLSVLVTQLIVNSFGDGSMEQTSSLMGLLYVCLALVSLGAFHALNAEGPALWLLYASPISIKKFLGFKFKFWLTASLLIGSIVLLWFHFQHGWTLYGIQGMRTLAFAMGLGISTAIALSLGIFGSDPLHEDPTRRVRGHYTLFFIGLSTLYLPMFYTSSIWQAAVHLLLMLCFSYALWQSASEHILYLLDPGAAPPLKVSILHGLIATLIYSICSSIIYYFASAEFPTLLRLLIGSACGGALVYLGMNIYFKQNKALGQPVYQDARWKGSVLLGVLAGFLAAAGAMLYANFATRLGWIEVENFPVPRDFVWFAVMAIVVAPLVEEYIFRGLILQGLQRAWHPSLAAIASAIIFGAMHPLSGFIPVTLLGLLTAYLYQHRGSLVGPMVCHAVYNACVLGPLRWA